MKYFFAVTSGSNGVIAEVRFRVPETSAFRWALGGEDVTCREGWKEVVETPTRTEE